MTLDVSSNGATIGGLERRQLVGIAAAKRRRECYCYRIPLLLIVLEVILMAHLLTSKANLEMYDDRFEGKSPLVDRAFGDSINSTPNTSGKRVEDRRPNNHQTEQHQNHVGISSKGMQCEENLIAEQPDHKNLAIIIPFRESTMDKRSQGMRREQNLKLWLLYMRNYLPTSLLCHSQVFVVEQTQVGVFNKGALFNVGYIWAFENKDDNTTKFDYMILHDVDQIPQQNTNPDIYNYRIDGSPAKLIQSTTRKANFTAPEQPRKLFPSNVGGALLVTPHVYRSVNGYSNNFGGWGGEDDNMANRLLRHQKQRLAKRKGTDGKAERTNTLLSRYGYNILNGKFRELYHDRVGGLDTNEQMKKNRKQINDFESGISNLVYAIRNTTTYTVRGWNVTRILVDVQE